MLIIMVINYILLSLYNFGQTHLIMRKIYFTVFIYSAFLVMGCKSKNQSSNSADSATVSEAPAPTAETTATPASPANEPKTYSIKFSPDTALLGKKKEAAVKLIGVSAVDLSDPEGKSQGIELTFKMNVTNRNKIGDGEIYFAPDNFRLILDNNTSISQTSGSGVQVAPESSKESDVITYRLPAGSKPKTLNLFHDETRSSVGLTIE